MQLAPRLVDGPMAADFHRHRTETQGPLDLVGAWLLHLTPQGHRARPGGANLAGFIAAQPDPPPKLAGIAFAFEQLKLGGYALLARVASRAGDEGTVALAEELGREERTAAAAVAGAWDAAPATLGDVEIAPSGGVHA